MHNASYANRLLSYCLIDWDRYIYNSIFYAMCSYVLCCILRFSVHFYVCFQVFCTINVGFYVWNYGY